MAMATLLLPPFGVKPLSISLNGSRLLLCLCLSPHQVAFRSEPLQCLSLLRPNRLHKTLILSQSLPNSLSLSSVMEEAPVGEMEAVKLDGDLEPPIQYTRINTIIEPDGASLAGRHIFVGGWVKTGREQGKGSFASLELSDGSCGANLQVICDGSVYPLAKLTPTGRSW